MIDRGVRSWARRLAIGVGLAGVVVLASIAAAAPGGSVAADPGPAVAPELAPWTGGINFYRKGVFTTQASWLYCTAADVQIIRNMVEGTSDHRSSAQTTYFDWMRTQNRYDLPLSAGVDPAGWAAGMQHFVDARYGLVSSPSFNGTLRTAVTAMRRTNLPVAITVAHGNHGWVLNGFTATADPAVTADFEITSVSVTGPLWGLQSKGGYDMPPNTTLSVDELRTYFTRWHYDPLPMIWDGSFISIQPTADGAPPAPVVTLAPSPQPVAPTPVPNRTPVPPVATPAPGPTPSPTARSTPSVSPSGQPSSPVPGIAAGRTGPPASEPPLRAAGGSPAGSVDPGAVVVGAAIVVLLLTVGWASAGRLRAGRERH